MLSEQNSSDILAIKKSMDDVLHITRHLQQSAELVKLSIKALNNSRMLVVVWSIQVIKSQLNTNLQIINSRQLTSLVYLYAPHRVSTVYKPPACTCHWRPEECLCHNGCTTHCHSKQGVQTILTSTAMLLLKLLSMNTHSIHSIQQSISHNNTMRHNAHWYLSTTTRLPISITFWLLYMTVKLPKT
jgi:hypothetical protein